MAAPAALPALPCLPQHPVEGPAHETPLQPAHHGTAPLLPLSIRPHLALGGKQLVLQLAVLLVQQAVALLQLRQAAQQLLDVLPLLQQLHLRRSHRRSAASR
jgi:hypothetical protein